MATVRLCKVDFNNRYEDVIDFETSNQQTTYFTSKAVATIQNFQYVKKNDSYIVVNYALDSDIISNTNYIFVSNGDYNYFFFVTDKRYNTITSCFLDIELDYWNTYPLNIKWSFSNNYVVREHQNRWDSNGNPIWSDTDEGFNVSLEHPVSINTVKQSTLAGVMECCYVLFLYVTEDSFSIYCKPWTYDGKLFYDRNNKDISFSASNFGGKGYDVSNVNIKNVYVIPYLPNSISNVGLSSDEQGNYHIFLYSENISGIGDCISIYTSSPQRRYVSLKKISSVTKPDYSYLSVRDIANESKMFSSQFYKHIFVSHNQKIDIKNEYLNSNSSINYYISGSANRTVSYLLYSYGMYETDFYGSDSIKYYGVSDNSFSQLPTLNDTDGMYLASHQNQIQVSYFASLFNTFASMASGAFLTSINPAYMPFSAVKGVQSLVSSVSNIATENAKVEDSKNAVESFQTSNSDGNFDYGVLSGGRLLEAEFTCADDVRTAIYDYLYMFGYSCNKIKFPVVNTRFYFNYLKLNGLNVDRNFPDNEGLSVAAYEKLRNIFENGVRIWHYNSNTAGRFRLYNYTNENAEV